MFSEVVQRYVNMGANQFVKDFPQKWQVKKAMAHRQMVMVRKERQLQKESKVNMKEIEEDHCPQKEKSDNQLKGLISKFGNAVLANLYTRAELVTLCKGYGLNPASSMNKALIGKNLARKIDSCTNVPYPWSLVP